MIKNYLLSLLSAKGRLNRIGFFHSFIFMMCLFGLIAIANREYLDRSGDALTLYLYANVLQSILLLGLWTPSIIKRLHDLGIHGSRAAVPWVAMLLDSRTLILIDIHAARLVEEYHAALFALYGIAIIFYLALFMLPGSRDVNAWGQPLDD